MDIHNIQVRNMSQTITFATAPAGEYMSQGSLQQVITQPAQLSTVHPLVEHQKYLIKSTELNPQIMTYNGTVGNNELWFVSQ